MRAIFDYVGIRQLTRALFLCCAATTAAFAQRTQPRTLPDPGVVTTGQRISPAGVQSIYDGRVFGVTFGRTSDDIWVLVAANNARQPAVMNLSWRDNRVIGSAPIAGATLAPQGIRFDATLDAPLVTYAARVSPRPGAPPAGTAMVQLATVGDGGAIRTIASPLGATATGAPAIAKREDAAARRLAVVPLTFNDSLAIVDTKTGAVLGRAPTGIAPFGAVIDSMGTTAFVTNWGGRLPVAGDRTATTGIAPTADRVVVDARGIASTGTVTRVDLATARATHTIAVGLHPTAIVWDERRHSVYVANGQSDAISVIDSWTNVVARTITISPFRDRTRGLAPTALALSPDGSVLYVALGGVNAIAVIDAVRGELRGMIPTGWYPNALAVSADGRLLAVATLYGVGSGAETAELSAASPQELATNRRYVHRYRGTVSVVEVPTELALAQFTAAVSANVQLALGAEASSAARLLAPRANAVRRAVPERHGEASTIEHVVYIVKENRTYDQVFGDLPRGNGDSSLAIYGRRVTPNHHRLAEQFALFDNFYATGGNSGNGHQWVTQANETEYTLWPGYQGRSYPFDGADPIAPASGGFLWDAVLAKKKTVKIFGEYAGTVNSRGRPSRVEMLTGYRAGRDVSGGINTVAPNHSVDALVARDFPGYGGIIPDVVRAQIFLRHLAQWQRDSTMPNLVLIQLPSDHTGGTQEGYSTPAACVADNDVALGQIVEALTKSPFWKSMAIFVVEDDAQGGVDHVDGHRTVALAISPYTKRGSVDNTMYAQQSMVKTIELMLGTNPMGVFDLTAPSMSRSFIGPDEQPNLTPYTVVEPEQSIYEENPKARGLEGPAREAALASARMNFAVPDAAPSEKLNRILWHTAKGWNTPYPGVQRAFFFPLAADLADDEREEEEEGEEEGEEMPRSPFLFASVTPAAHAGMTTAFDAGYNLRAFEPVAGERWEPRVGALIAFSSSVALQGQLAVASTLDRRTRAAGQMELMVTPFRRDATSFGASVGLRREYSGANVALGRMTGTRLTDRTALAADVLFEHPYVSGRDAVDIVTSIGAARAVTPRLWLGVEAVGSDLEGLVDSEEAEGGARVLLGPTLALGISDRARLVLGGGMVLSASTSSNRAGLGEVAGQRSGYVVRTSLRVGW